MVEAVDEVFVTLAALPVTLKQNMTAAVFDAAALARTRAPRRTGALAASITGAQSSDGARLEVAAPYARFVQFGTRKMRAQPFVPSPAKLAAAALAFLRRQVTGIE